MLRIAIPAALIAVLSTPVVAQCTEQVLAGSVADSVFGRSVDIDGDLMAIGVVDPDGSGEALIWERTGPGATWTFLTTLPSPTDPNMGRSVSVSGDRVAVGSPGSVNGGRVYVVDQPGVGQTVTVINSPTPAVDAGEFGFSVALDGDRLVVGEPGAYAAEGRLHIYDRQPNGTWLLDTTWEPAAPFHELDPDDRLGHVVDVSGDFVIVTAPGGVGPLVFSGFAYIVEDVTGTGWVTNVSYTSGGQNYGLAAAIDGDHAAVGAPSFDVGGSNNLGRVDFFVFNGTIFQTDTTVTGAVAGDQLGFAVDISGETAIIGSPGADAAGTNSGASHLFRFDGSDWLDTGLAFTATGSVAGDAFGHAVALDAASVAVTAELAESGGHDTGVVTTYEKPGFGLCASVASGLAGTGGLTPALVGSGGTSPGGPVALTLSQGLANTTGFLFLGFTTINAPFKGGVMVPSPDVIVPITTDATGGVVISSPYPSGVPSDVPVWSQAWLNDAGAILGVSASNTPVLVTL
jgi:hypothetical protein